VIDNVGGAAPFRESKRLGPRLPSSKRHLKTLTVQQVHEILGACQSYQERLFVMFAFTTGMRIGQILGLRHGDIDTRRRVITITPRQDNENLARAKTRRQHEIPMSREASRLYVTYMHEEYGYVDSDYVFISMAKDRLGDALSPSTVYGFIGRIQRTTGITGWSPHTLRHTFVTLQREAGMPIDVISHLVTHASIATTVDTYSHLSVEELRATLLRHGAWEVEDVA
jgi:integrase